MSDLVVTCDRCKAQLQHVCNADLRQAIVQLFSWTPEDKMSKEEIEQAKELGYYSEGDEYAPFMSEAYTYNLLGKEDARTLLALVNNVIRAAGVDPRDPSIIMEVNKIDENRATERERQKQASLAYAARKAAKKKSDAKED